MIRRIPGLIRLSDLAIASIGPRSLVATGPEEIVAAKWEFEADTERFLRAAEVNSLIYSRSLVAMN